jgi:hypothetical protein
MKKTLFCLVFSFLITNSLLAQDQASTVIDTLKIENTKKLDFKYNQLIIPTVFIGYGIIGLESGQIKGFNSGVKDEVTEHVDNKLTVDDFTQYLPVAALYGVSAFGVKGKNSTKDKTIILGTSYLLMGLTVNAFKQTASVQRPDGSSLNSFPSGHTATAFMGAELLYQEYKEESIWYGISGYIVATGTGAFRMYNNRHWLSDVVTGAGIGILSAKAGYWLYPVVSKLFYNKKSQSKTVFVPFYNGENAGFGLVSKF